jgi:hypothetical protein
MRRNVSSAGLAAPLVLLMASAAAPAAPPAVPVLGPTAESAGRGLAALVRTESVEMAWAIATGSQIGPGSAWFHPAQGRYGWKWLANRYDANKDGKIDPREFPGPAELFVRLDRNHDGVLTAADFDWTWRPPPRPKAPPPAVTLRRLFSLLDDDEDGEITREEWDEFFARAAGKKGVLTAADLRKALAPKPSAKAQMAAALGKLMAPSPKTLFKGLLTAEIGSPFEGPRLGERAPDFSLKTFDGKGTWALSERRGKPVVLVFGSFT